jgi:hypothetical protein
MMDVLKNGYLTIHGLQNTLIVNKEGESQECWTALCQQHCDVVSHCPVEHFPFVSEKRSQQRKSNDVFKKTMMQLYQPPGDQPN